MSPEEELRMMTAADAEPTLSSEEIARLLERFSNPATYSLWAPDTAYTVGQRVTPYPRNGLVYIVTVAGQSESAQPVFPVGVGDVVTDGGVTWMTDKTEYVANMNRAAAEGWLLKAGKVANRFDMKTEVTTTSRSQLHKQCMEMYKTYRRRNTKSIPVSTAHKTFESVSGNT